MKSAPNPAHTVLALDRCPLKWAARAELALPPVAGVKVEAAAGEIVEPVVST